MNEGLLQFIWHHQYFNVTDLRTVAGESLEVIDSGIWNKNQGPDFLQGRIRINGENWAGHIELHVRTSDWDLHGHALDPNYGNVILHVVWEHNKEMEQPIPVLELKSRVPAFLMARYRKWMMRAEAIPCSGEIGIAGNNLIYSWLDRLSSQRISSKSDSVWAKVRQLGMDWEEAFWQSLARAFGHKVNADAFEAIASSLPVRMMMKYRNNLIHLEALLLGQGGLLRTDIGDEYSRNLFREYGFLRKKHQLVKTYNPVHFLRMRPGNFPTIRLAQLAALLARNRDLFRGVLELKHADEIRDFFRVEAGEYWDRHYRFGEPSVFLKKQTGEQFIENLLINTVIPFLLAYYQHSGNTTNAAGLIDIMKGLKPEMNATTAYFTGIGVASTHAWHSQGLLELKKNYCDQLRCLECAIGKWIMTRVAVAQVCSG